MKLLYLDCFAGMSGDMFLGAALDLGVSLDKLRAELGKMPLRDYRLSAQRVTKQNIAATKFNCEEMSRPGPSDRHGHQQRHQHGHHHTPQPTTPEQVRRGYAEIAAIIERSDLAANVKQQALSIFRRIGEVEAKIHGIPLAEVHFHEIGAVDSIVDVVGACIAVAELGAPELQAAPPPLGSGFVETAHGRFPVPAPATLELLKDVPVQSSTEPVELVTPTGAAILAEFCTKFGPMPTMRVEKIGYGAGTRELAKTPNVLRAVLGDTAIAAETDTVAVIETNIDDMNPQWFGDVMERLLAAGALDVFLTPVQMKKNRPGTLVTVLCAGTDVDRFAELLLTQTTSFGVRIHEAHRRVLAREIIQVPTKFGAVVVKIGRLGGRVVARSPEYESCKQAAAQAGVPVREVYQAAALAAETT